MTFSISMKLRSALSFLALLLPLSGFAQGHDISETTRSRINEVHAKWTVMCLPRDGTRVCAVRRLQSDRQTKKPFLLIELRPTSQGSAKGGIMLPKDLQPDAVVHFALDGNAASHPLEIKECSDRGCGVTVTFSGAAFEKLRSGKVLQLRAIRIDGTPQMFEVDLNGFAAAVERGIELEGSCD